MFRLIFWNVNRNTRTVRPLAELVKAREIDLVVLAESPDAPAVVSAEMTARVGSPYTWHTGRINKRVTVLARESVSVGEAVAESHYVVIHPIRIGPVQLLLAGIHGISRLEDDLVDLDEEAGVAASLLRDTELAQANRHTVLVGDFNLNPFDAGMAKARGFFGVMSRRDASREQRRLKWNDYPLFYNPMWSRLGDTSPGPPGTFYRERSSHVAYYWHTYDQVLLRPSLVECFDPANLEVVTALPGYDLMKDGVPNRDDYSDHLPVVIGLDLSKVQARDG